MSALRHSCIAALLSLLTPAGVSAQGTIPPPYLFEVHEVGVADLQEALSRGEVTSVELVDAFMARIRAYDQGGPGLNAILTLNPDARPQAAELDRERIEWGPRGPLHGIPVLLKDNIDMIELPTTAASFALTRAVPADDAHIVRRLREGGAIILGKTNLHELSIGITSVSSLDGQTLNPYDITRNPGGSSGGTGVAVAASFAVFGYGTDTCGSLRIPAAFNALFGLRPTKGLISMDGVMPVSHSQDVVGPLARTAGDLAVALDAVVGFDADDPATRMFGDQEPPRFADALRTDALEGVRIGVLEAYLDHELLSAEVQSLLVPEALLGGSGDVGEQLHASIRDKTGELEATMALIREAYQRMEDLGAEIVPLEIPGLDTLLQGSSVVEHEFKFALESYLRRVPSSPVRSLSDILERGLYHPSLEAILRERNRPLTLDSDEYRRALRRRDAVRETLLAVMEREELDAISYPTMRRGPALLGEPQRGSTCQLSAASGLPALTLPAGLTEDGLPVGFELLGGHLDDARLVGFAYAYEQRAHPRQPPEIAPPLESRH